MTAMSNPTSKYTPPSSTEDLVLAWLRRSREAQLCHYEMSTKLSMQNLVMGVPVIMITALVGTSAFASILSELIPIWAKIAVGFTSLLAAVISSLQTFFKFSERSEQHKTFAAKFGAVRRELEVLHVSGNAFQEPSYVNVLRDKLDRLAEEAPAIPPRIFSHIQDIELKEQRSLKEVG